MKFSLTDYSWVVLTLKIFFLSNESLAVGTIIQIADKDYCIVTISIIEPSKMLIEVC